MYCLDFPFMTCWHIYNFSKNWMHKIIICANSIYHGFAFFFSIEWLLLLRWLHINKNHSQIWSNVTLINLRKLKDIIKCDIVLGIFHDLFQWYNQFLSNSFFLYSSFSFLYPNYSKTSRFVLWEMSRKFWIYLIKVINSFCEQCH